VTISSSYIRDSGNQVTKQIDRSPTIYIREGHSKQRSNASEDNVHRELIRCLDDGDAELLAERHERWIYNGASHRPQETED
jgi:hypothetical protein